MNYEIDAYEREIDLPYKKISVRLTKKQHGKISFSIPRDHKPYAIRMFARYWVAPWDGARRFLINGVFTGSTKIPLIPNAPKPFGQLISDVYSMAESPVLTQWEKWEDKITQTVTFEIENYIHDHEISATIVLYFMPKHKTSVLSKIRGKASVPPGPRIKPTTLAQKKNDWDEEWISKNLDSSKERIVFERDEVLQAMRAVRQRILERANEIYTTMGSSLHNPGDKIKYLIKEFEDKAE